MRRVVVTGMGIVSSIGNNTQEVLASLREAKSGIVARRRIRRARLPLPGARRADARSGGDRSTAAPCASSAAAPPGTTSPWIRRSATPASRRTRSPTSAPASSWARAGPRPAPSSRPPTPPATKGPKRVGPFAVPKAMSSTASATLATWFKIKGVNYSISSACATSNHCIGNAAETDPVGQAGHDLRRRLRGARLDAVGAVRRHGRDVVATTTTRRQKASRAYDKDRDGFVIAGGAGVLVLEELEHAKARGAQDLRRGRRLRRDLGRLRHGGAVGRGRGALHEDGARERRRRRSTTSTRTPPRRRSATSRRSRRSARCSAPSARRSRRPSR